jgi:uncharacterized protein (TIGR02145 family)
MGIKVFTADFNRIRVANKPVVPSFPTPVTDAGVYFSQYGGYYAGGNINVDGTEYAIFVAPKAGGEATLAWNTNDSIAGAYSLYNGRLNTLRLADYTHPAAKFCSDLNLNGFDDWHLPSNDELEIMYRFLKPTTDDNYTGQSISRGRNTKINGVNPNSIPLEDGYTANDPSQTTATLFQEGNSEAFDTTQQYWTSSEEDQSGYDYALTIYFRNGYQTGRRKDLTANLRAVRWVQVQ